MKRIAIAAIAALLVTTSPAASQEIVPVVAFANGNQLHSSCAAEKRIFHAGVCYGYTVGVADALSAFRKICVPSEKVNRRQIRDIAINYLETHPEERHLSAMHSVAMALIDAFTCREQRLSSTVDDTFRKLKRQARDRAYARELDGARERELRGHPVVPPRRAESWQGQEASNVVRDQDGEIK